MKRRPPFSNFLTVLGVLLLSAAMRTYAEPSRLTVKVNQPGAPINPLFYGLMTEEINHSYDGGLYGELIQNRAFQDDPKTPAHWSLVQDGGGAGSFALNSNHPATPALPTSLTLSITAAAGTQRVGIANDGYWGIPVKPRTAYRASFYAKAGGDFPGPLTVDIESSDGHTVYAHAQVSHITASWQRYTVTLTTGDAAPAATNRFVISASRPGVVWFSLVSLFPPTFHNRPNGNRIDLMQKLGAMNPAFLRMPGGNYLEGNTLAERFDWKKTLGSISQRPGHQGPWGYRSTDGMGLLEFLEWCEDLHMQPLLAVFAGYALQGQHVYPGPDLQPYVQDALDEIEYVTGDASTKWGAERARDGHPAPFPLTYVEIGNEDFFDRSGSYDGRFAQFFDAIKAKYPKLQLIATAGVKTRTPDMIDDHFYHSVRDMENDVHHYDGYSRSGPKVFVGEWASQDVGTPWGQDAIKNGAPTPTLNAALGDAVWLTGLERNADVVMLECYAPLLVNVNPGARQWAQNLIGYDALNSYGSPSYYVQAMFGNNRGDVVLPVDIAPSAAPAPTAMPHGKIGVATWATQAEFKEIQVSQGTKTLYTKNFSDGTADWNFGQGQWQAQGSVLRQSSVQTDCRATAGDPGWTDYTYHLQARKLSGQEGFMISFHVQSDDERIWWNVGGWGNTRTALERFHRGSNMELGPSVPVTVETGRWYDIRIEVQGRRIRCYLDGKLTTEATDAPVALHSPVYASASRVLATGDVILKIVNTAPDAQPLQIDLQGVRNAAKTGTIQVLTGQPGDHNTPEAPEKVVPKTLTLTGTAPSFTHIFPAYSVSVIRLNVTNQ